MRRHRLFLGLCSWVACLLLPGPAARAQSWWDTVLRITGITATPSQLKGPEDDPAAGDVWVINLAQKTRQRLTFDGGYRSPLFLPGDAMLLALKGEAVVQMPRAGGEPVTRQTVPGVRKLVGVHHDDGDKVLLVLRRPEQPLGLLSLRSGAVAPLPFSQSPEDQRRYNHIVGWERVYGDTTLLVQEQPSQATWTDIYLRRGNTPAENLSRCQNSTCSQPSLSHDGGLVAFIKSEH
jgi:hypothetical protein